MGSETFSHFLLLVAAINSIEINTSRISAYWPQPAIAKLNCKSRLSTQRGPSYPARFQEAQGCVSAAIFSMFLR